MSEETYSFLCPSCSAHLSVPITMAGVSGPCPYCASPITSPMPDEVPAEDLRAIEEAALPIEEAALPIEEAALPIEEAALPLGDEAATSEAVDDQPPHLPAEEPDAAAQISREPGTEQLWSTEPTEEPGAPPDAPTATANADTDANAEADTVEVDTVEAEQNRAQLPAQRGGRRKRGERVPKGKHRKRKQPATRDSKPKPKPELKPKPERREETPSKPARERVSATVVDAPPDRGLSLGAKKVCLGVAGIALVALAAIYGLPAIMGDGDSKSPPPAKASPNVTPGNQGGDSPAPDVETLKNAADNTPQPVTPKPELPVAPVRSSDSAPSGLPAAPETIVDAPDTDTRLPASMTSYTPAPDSILLKPRQVLEGFLAARNWKDRLQYVTGGQALAKEMQAYYTEYPDGALDPVSINWTLNDTDPDGVTRIFVFTTSFDIERDDGITYLDFPTVVEARDGSYTINWQSFVEFKDRHLNEFVTRREFDKPGRFHVITVRAHYFGSDSELKQKVESGELVCVTAESPNPDDVHQAFLNTRARGGREMAARLGWAKAASGGFDTPLVVLCWKKTASGTPYIEITEVLGDKWRDSPK